MADKKAPSKKEPAFTQRDVRDFTKKGGNGTFDDLEVEVLEYTLERNQFNKLISKEKNYDSGEETTNLKLH